MNRIGVRERLSDKMPPLSIRFEEIGEKFRRKGENWVINLLNDQKISFSYG